MFIQTEITEQPDAMRFLPGCDVYAGGALSFSQGDDISTSPLAQRLLAVDNVAAVELGADYIQITKSESVEWLHLKPAILGAIMDHFVAGLPVVNTTDSGTAAAVVSDDTGDDGLVLDESDPVVSEIRELIETRIRPAAAQGGGEVTLRGYSSGVVYLELTGSAFGLKSGIENMLRHYVPEIERVADWHDAVAKPGLDTPEGKAVQALLDSSINPSVAGHGGHIALIDVKDDRVYIRMEGGCQGCGMADVTLKQGVEGQIRKEIPSIREVLDVTDHAGGTNPYYQG
jgi:Fe-S cluster biogenesis protein NfuA